MGIEGTLGEVLVLVHRFAPGPPPELHPSGMGLEEASAERPLVGPGGWGFDSVRLIELLLACEDRFGVSLEVDRLAADNALSAAGIAAAIDEARGEAGRG